MTKTEKAVTPVKGGWIVRDAASGAVQEVRRDEGGKSKSSRESSSSMKAVSAKRSAALRRLADR